MNRTIAFLLLLSMICPLADASNSINDFEAVKERARQENKDVLLSFSGYRWWSKTIGIDTNAEDPWINKHFIMLEVDIPRQHKGAVSDLPTDQQALRELRKWFHQDADEPSPTLLLLDASGKPYAELDSHEQPPEAYKPEMQEAIHWRINRDAAFQRAREAKGMEKAKFLHQGLIALSEVTQDGETLVSGSQLILVDLYYQDIIEEISQHDPQDLLGRGQQLAEIKQAKKEEAEWQEIETLLKDLESQLNEMLLVPQPLSAYLTQIDKFLATHSTLPTTTLHRVKMAKVEASLLLRDYSSALKQLDSLLSSNPKPLEYSFFESTLKTEIEKALQLTTAGTDQAVTDYRFRLLNFRPINLLDADGKRSIAEVKQVDEGMNLLLVEDAMHHRLRKIDLLLRVRDYEQALQTMDAFVKYDASSAIIKRHDHELRPFILRGLQHKAVDNAVPSTKKRQSEEQ